jgi:hypothetical protein
MRGGGGRGDDYIFFQQKILTKKKTQTQISFLFEITKHGILHTGFLLDFNFFKYFNMKL